MNAETGERFTVRDSIECCLILAKVLASDALQRLLDKIHGRADGVDDPDDGQYILDLEEERIWLDSRNL